MESENDSLFLGLEDELNNELNDLGLQQQGGPPQLHQGGTTMNLVDGSQQQGHPENLEVEDELGVEAVLSRLPQIQLVDTAQTYTRHLGQC